MEATICAQKPWFSVAIHTYLGPNGGAQEHRAFNSLLMSTAAANSAEACAVHQLMALMKTQKLDRWRNGMECDIFLPHLWLRLLWWLWSLLLCYYHHYQRYGYYSYGLILGIILLMIINYYHNVPIVGFMMTVMIMDMMLVIGNMMAKKHCDDW